MTVVLDCNILVMCLTSRSPYHIIFQSLIQNKFELAVSVDILLEYEEIVQQKYSVTTSFALISLLKELPNVRYINPHYKWQLIQADVDDNKYCLRGRTPPKIGSSIILPQNSNPCQSFLWSTGQK